MKSLISYESNTQISLADSTERAPLVGHVLANNRSPNISVLLSELLAQCDLDAKPFPDDREWFDDAPQGRELI